MTGHPEPWPDPWPLWRLALRTPRLELRPDDDAGLLELVDEAHRGVHPPAEMPFCHPWTDAPPAELGANTLRHYWEIRSRLGPDDWTINFLARLDGRVIGTQGLTGRDFARIRQVSTGSWIGSRHQGRGLGTEMRAAVLMFAFDQLGATVARSSAFADNPRSLGVSRRLGYVDDGTTTDLRRGVPATQVRLRLAAQGFRRPSWPLDVTGLAAVRSTLGVAAGVDRPGCGVR